MPYLKSRLALVIAYAALAYWGSFAALYMGGLETLAVPRTPGKRPTRSLGRSSGRSSSSAASRVSRRPAPQSQHGPHPPTSRAPPQQAPQPQRPSPPKPQHPSPPRPEHPPAHPPPPHASPPPHVAGPPSPPPPAFQYTGTHGNQAPHAPLGHTSTAGQGAPPLQPPAGAHGNTTNMPAVPSGAGGPSLARTAVSSAVGAAVGSMMGTAVANSLSHRSGSPAEASNTTTSTLSPVTATIADFNATSASDTGDRPTAAAFDSTYPSTQPHTTRFASTIEAPTSTQAARPALGAPARVRLVFPGVGERELQDSLTSAQAFGTLVQDAVVRSVGVPSGRVVLQDVSVTPAADEKEPGSAVVTLSLLPDERLLATEPSAQELAHEISRQLSQNTSYLTRQLRLAFPQLSDAVLQAGGVKAVVLAGTDLKGSSAAVGSASFGVEILCAFLAGMSIWL